MTKAQEKLLKNPNTLLNIQAQFTFLNPEFQLSTEQKSEMQRNLQCMIESMVSLILEITAPTGLLVNLKSEMIDLQAKRKKTNKTV